VSKLLSPKLLRILVPTVIVIGGLVLINVVFKIPGVALPEISIAAEKVFDFDLFGLWPLGITNTMLSSWLTTVFLLVAVWAIMRKKKEIPGRLQSALEMIIEGMYNLVEGAAGRKWARRFFVIASNWLGLTPLFGGWGALHHAEHGQPVNWISEGSVGLWVPAEKEVEAAGHEAEEGEHVEGAELYTLAPMFRAATTDLNVTIALALVSVVMTQYFGLSALGIGYLGKFINVGGFVKAFTEKGKGCMGRVAALGMGIIDFFIGMVELISEIGKIVSFSFRLFGNIFAGEVLLGVMAFLIPYIISLPFYGLELFVGFVQALVFMMLTVAFFIVATTSHGEEGH
jgi:F-type H+-transporting ATPase subunit a